jgi:hypothetical protein
MNANKFDFSRWMSGSVRPDARHRLEIAWHLEDYARATLSALGLAVPDHRANLFAAYTEHCPLAVDDLREKIAEWVSGEHQRRAASVLGVSQASLAKKLSGKQDWPADEVIRWARLAGLLPAVDAPEDAESIGDETDALTATEQVWEPMPRPHVRDEPTWLGDAVEEWDDEDEQVLTDDTADDAES